MNDSFSYQSKVNTNFLFSSSKLSELVSHEDKHLKSVFSCDSLSLISIEKTQKDIENQLNSFYLKNLNYLKKESIPSLPLVKLRSLITNDNTKSIPNRSIIKDLNSLSNSFKEKNLHQSIDSLFSKDSLVQ